MSEQQTKPDISYQYGPEWYDTMPHWHEEKTEIERLSAEWSVRSGLATWCVIPAHNTSDGVERRTLGRVGPHLRLQIAEPDQYTVKPYFLVEDPEYLGLGDDWAGTGDILDRMTALGFGYHLEHGWNVNTRPWACFYHPGDTGINPYFSESGTMPETVLRAAVIALRGTQDQTEP